MPFTHVKKPVQVEAYQWTGPGCTIRGVNSTRVFHGEKDCGVQYYVVTIHGDVINLEPGDWVITEPDGTHHYPCKPDIFEKSYEPLSKPQEKKE